MADEIVVVLDQDQARLGITWNGQYGELPDPMYFQSTEGDVRQIATEAVQGGIPGIAADPAANFADFVVERFSATATRPYNLIQLRPKTPFGVWRS